MDIVTRKQLNVLIHLAEVDKHFAPEERELITQIARRKNFPLDELDKLIGKPEPIGSLGALTPDQKFDYLINSIDLIFADQRVVESEIRFSKGIAMKLGFNLNVIEYLINNRGDYSRDELKESVIGRFL